MSKDGSLFVPAHAGLWENPKLWRLAKRLGVEDVQAVGHLIALWTWVVRYAADGDISGFDDDELEEAARWKGDRGAFVEAVRALGWVVDGHINDWGEYAGAGLEMRIGAVERQRAKRAGLSVEEYRKRAAPVSRDVTRDEPVTVTPPSRDVTPDRDRDRDRDRDPEEGEAPAPPAVDRSRQSTDAPPPAPGKMLSDDEIAAIRAGRPPQRLGFGGVGFMEDPAKFPQDVDELIAQNRADLTKSFPMLDGKPPRPSLRDAVASKWGAYIANRARNGGHANAYSALKTWLGEMAQKHRVSWEREHTTVVDNGHAKAATREILKPIEGPHPADDPEAAAAAARAMEAIKGIGKAKAKGKPP